MLDDILRFVEMFDWLTPIVAFGKDVTNGPRHTFMIPDQSGFNEIRVGNLLAANGIKSWGAMAVGHTFLITVSEPQAAWATYILEREGIPVENPYQKSEAPGKAPAVRTQKKRITHRSLLDQLGWAVETVADVLSPRR